MTLILLISQEVMTDISLNQIISIIGSVKKPHKFSVESESNFIQPLVIPENVIQEDEPFIEAESVSSQDTIHYEEEGVMMVPQIFSEFLDLNKYYIYGAKNYLETFQMLINETYMNMDAQSKKESCENFKINIIEKITPKYLKSIGISHKKADVVAAFNEPNIHFEYIKCVADTYNINVLYIDFHKKKYKLIRSETPDKTNKNIIVLMNENKLLPLVHIRYEMFNFTDLMKASHYFKEIRVLKKLSSYTYDELKMLASENNIPLFDTITNKKKTKAYLYEDLTKELQ